MLQNRYLNKLKDLPEPVRQFGGLVTLTIIVILSFAILNKDAARVLNAADRLTIESFAAIDSNLLLDGKYLCLVSFDK